MLNLVQNLMKVSFKYFLLLLHSNLVSSGKKLPNFQILATGNLLKSLLELNQKILGEKFSYFFLFQTFDILFKCLLQNDEASKYKQAWFKKFTSQPDKRWQWSMEDSLDWQRCMNVLVDKKIHPPLNPFSTPNSRHYASQFQPLTFNRLF